MPDPTDYCAMATWLRLQYSSVVGGGQAISIRIEGRETKYSTGNIDKLEALLLRYEGLCAKAQGDRPRRYAFRLGAYR